MNPNNNLNNNKMYLCLQLSTGKVIGPYQNSYKTTSEPTKLRIAELDDLSTEDLKCFYDILTNIEENLPLKNVFLEEKEEDLTKNKRPKTRSIIAINFQEKIRNQEMQNDEMKKEMENKIKTETPISSDKTSEDLDVQEKDYHISDNNDNIFDYFF